MTIKVKKFDRYDVDPHYGSGNCYSSRNPPPVFGLVDQKGVFIQGYNRRKDAEAIADFANLTGWDGETGDIEATYLSHTNWQDVNPGFKTATA